MISKKIKISLIAIGIISMMFITGVLGVPFASEYDTNNVLSQDNEWNQYRWQAENADVFAGGAVVIGPNQLYDMNWALSLPPGASVQYYLYLPGVMGSTIDVKNGTYRLFLFADTTNGPNQMPVQISVYIDFDFIQIVTPVTSPAAPNHCGTINPGWINFQDEPRTIGGAPPPLPCHVIEIANLDPINTIIIDEITISTAN